MYRKILITGGAGFIGSNFVHYLIQNQPQVQQIMVLDKLTYAGNRANLAGLPSNKVHLIVGDVCDKSLV